MSPRIFVRTLSIIGGILSVFVGTSLEGGPFQALMQDLEEL